MSDAGSEASAPRVKLSEEQTLVLVELQKLSQVAHAM